MNALVDTIIKFRQQICPRTSYVTGGNAASSVFCLTLTDQRKDLDAVLQGVLQRNEFEEVQSFPRYEDLFPHISQHVIVIMEDASVSTPDPRITDLLKMKRTKLVFSLQLATTSSAEPLKHEVIFRWSENEELCAISKVFCISNEFSIRLQIYYFHKIYRTPPSSNRKKIQYPSIPLGYNKQPSVASRLQFRFLWNLWPEEARAVLPCVDQPDQLLDNKRRVLQRIADRDCIGDSKDRTPRKYSTKQWDEWITNALLQNADDWDIYSMIRQKTIGSSLEADTDPLSLLLESSTTASTANSAPVEINTQNNEERSDYLVDRIFDSLPESIRQSPRKYIQSFLDYGCAEGGMTTALGEKLQLPPQAIFGADVRTIPSRSFQFLRLAAEQRNTPPTIGSILPSLQQSQISLINASMVFHHVMHIDQALLELRRVIANETGILLVREHDCTGPASAAFLDIVHGLYALSWQNPVEWPDFIEEAEAFYRSRSQWNALLDQYGFQLRQPQPPLYDQVERSVYNVKKERFANVVRGYYAIYLPKKDFPLMMYLATPSPPIPSSNHILTTTIIQSKASKRNRSQLEEPESGVNTTNLTTTPPREDRLSHPPQKDDYRILESKQYPGFFYKFFIYQDRSEWIS